MRNFVRQYSCNTRYFQEVKRRSAGAATQVAQGAVVRSAAIRHATSSDTSRVPAAAAAEDEDVNREQ